MGFISYAIAYPVDERRTVGIISHKLFQVSPAACCAEDSFIGSYCKEPEDIIHRFPCIFLHFRIFRLRIKGCEIVLTNKVEITAEIMDVCPEMRYIGVLSTRYNVVDVSAAKNDLEQAKKSLQDVDTGMETIRRSLGLQLGWDGNTLPEIGTLPEPDVAFVDTTNPDADKSAAIMHNSEVKATWKPDYSSSYGFELRDREENEVTGRLVAKMDSLYADMKQKKALYETAKTTLEKARLTRESAERRYELGMLGRSEYEAQQLSYLNYEASYRLAELNLFQSINTYKWAVDGVVTID